jgi:hypothetical protein
MGSLTIRSHNSFHRKYLCGETQGSPDLEKNFTNPVDFPGRGLTIACASENLLRGNQLERSTTGEARLAAKPMDPKELGYYFTLAQVGLEMVAPLGLGLVLDYYLSWTPWGLIGGTVFGFVGGVAHLVVLSNRHHTSDTTKPGRKRS